MNEDATAATLRLLAESIWAVLQVAEDEGVPDESAFDMATGCIDELQEFLTELRELSGLDIQHETCREDFESIVEQLRLFADDLG